jgi:hypothetical protein
MADIAPREDKRRVHFDGTVTLGEPHTGGAPMGAPSTQGAAKRPAWSRRNAPTSRQRRHV